MTRTLWVTTDFPPRAGGIEQFLVNLVRRLDPAATRVVTAPWPNDGPHDAANPWRTDRVMRRPLLPLPATAALLRRAVAEHRADVVVVGGAWPLGELGDRLGVPTLALTMGHEAGMARVGLGPLLTRVARKVNALGVLSAFTRRELARWTGDTPIHDVLPGVDTDVFHPGVDGAAVRARHGVPADAPLAVCVSRLVRRKGQDVLVEAWPEVIARVPGARLLLAGTGPLAGPLAGRVRALGLEGRVVLAGEVPWAELPAYHAAGDVFAMPCRTRAGGLDVEGLGIVYLEAQACGLPVVAGRSGGAPETVVEGETGVTVDGASRPRVADAVATLLRHPRRVAMGVAARDHVQRRWSWPVVTAGFHGLLATLASGDRPPLPRR